MQYINVDKNLPGMRSLMAFSPETAEPMGVLAKVWTLFPLPVTEE
jgi:hypothetical protein